MSSGILALAINNGEGPVKLAAYGYEDLSKVIFDPEKKTVEVVVLNPVHENLSRVVDLSDSPEVFDELRENIEEVLLVEPSCDFFTPYVSVTPNEDRTVFEVM